MMSPAFTVADFHNQLIESAELAEWSSLPDAMVAYYTFPDTHRGLLHCTFQPVGAFVSTWKGARLGTITSAHVYRHNFGARMVSLRVQGTNGAEYYGRASWDGGNMVRLRKVKR